jgi:hypothetical protein
MTTNTPQTTAPSRPNAFDYLVLMLGCSLSLLLLQLPLPSIEARAPADPFVSQKLLPFLVNVMRLSEGLILVWPILYPAQRLLGRTQPITAVEWLWICAWLGVALINGFNYAILWLPKDLLKASLVPLTFWPSFTWYVIAQPTIAVMAVLFALFGLFRRDPAPWTHVFGTVLLIWPVLPMLLTLVLGQMTPLKVSD